MTFVRLMAPLAGFRPYDARDYQETLPLPPHSTVFGALLSFMGVERDGVGPYAGTRLGLAGRAGDRSTVLRKMRRDPANPKKGQPRIPAFRPEYQEILSDVVLWCWVEKGEAERDLGAAIRAALSTPELVSRHGVVSLGESCFMLDSIAVGEGPETPLTVLRPRPDGSLSLTLWVDFTNRGNSRAARFEPELGELSSADAIPVGP